MKLSSNVFVISILVLGLITSPLSFAQTSTNSTEDITIELDESISITAENAEPEDTEIDNEIDNDITNLGQQISDFVHESRKLFQQQKEESREAIMQCRENVRNAEPSERESVRELCRDTLDEIRESYKSLREIYQETFKEFRENIKVFIRESKGLPIDPTQRDVAISNIKSLSDNPEKRELIRELQQKMTEQIREDKQKVREQDKKEREIMREKQENTRETLKAEQEKLKDQEKKQREMEGDTRQDKTLDDESSEENELEIEVEIKGGIAKITMESNGEELEFEMNWIDRQNTIAEIASRTGLTISQIEEVIEFEIESENESDEDDESDDSEQDDSEDS